MLILTGANSDIAKRKDGKIYKGFSFKGVIQKTVKKAEELGYTPLVYDLGGLGIGTLYPLNNITSNALFKPVIVKDCLNKYNDVIVYLDGDAQLCASIDEVAVGDYDVGVTLREASEIDNEWFRKNFEWTKYLNAGVMIFKPTEATKKFVELWHKTTVESKDDQVALNKLACPDDYPRAGSIITINGVRFKYFPCKQYNYYYFNDEFVDNIKILHFKGIVRHFYPFTWEKKLYCMTIVPIINKLKILIKGLI